MTDGQIAWDRARGDFDRTVTNCVPATLYGRLPEEPRWIELRGARELASLPPTMVADLAAPLHHRDKDELIGEDLRLHRRAIRLARAGVTVLAITTVVAVVAAVVAFVQARVATEQRNLAQEKERIAIAGELTASAASAARSNPTLALRLGLAAVAVNPGPKARAGLVDTLLTTRYLGEVGRRDDRGPPGPRRHGGPAGGGERRDAALHRHHRSGVRARGRHGRRRHLLPRPVAGRWHARGRHPARIAGALPGRRRWSAGPALAQRIRPGR